MLEHYIEAEVARILRSESPSQSVIFTGNRHDAIPAFLITDPVLEPVDKLVWMVASTGIARDSLCGVLPSYKELACLANVRSSSTIARALTILRATRWLTLCRQVRDGRGRFRGNVYAMHNEPAALAEVLSLDGDYFNFLKRASEHLHQRVQRVARSIQASIDEDVTTDHHGLPEPSTMERRLSAAQALSDASGGRYFSLTANAREDLNNARRQKDDRVRISKTVGSSSDVEKTTTTTSNVLSENEQRLVFPTRLNAAQRELARKYLRKVPAEKRQALLDELEGRLQAERYGARPVWDAIRYLARLCKGVESGEFEPNLGLSIAAERERFRKQIAEGRAKAQAETPETSARAEENIQKLRDIVARSLGEKE